MTNQSMMLGVPAGVEPVSERSLAEAPPAPVETPKPKRKREVAGRFAVDVDGEKYRIEMRDSGLTVRRDGKHHVDTKTMREVVDFVTGQGRLALDALVEQQEKDVIEFIESNPTDAALWPNPIKEFQEEQSQLETLLECCIEFIAAQTMKVNDPKFEGRYRLAASALLEQVDALAPGKVDEVLKGL